MPQRWSYRVAGAFAISPEQALITPIAIPLMEIKNRMGGLQYWLRDAAKLDSPYTDDTITKHVITAVRRMEEDTQTRITPVQIVSTNLDGTFNAGTVPDTASTYDPYGNQLPLKIDSPYPYFRDDATEYFKMCLRERPILTVQRIRVIAGVQQALFLVPTEWLNWDVQSGRMWLLPINTGNLLTAFSTTFSLIELNFGQKNYIPNLIHVDYQAGLPFGWEQHSDYAPLRRCIAEMAAQYVMEDISELYHAGRLSVTVSDGEGLSHTWSYSRFEKRKKELMESVARYQQVWENQHTPFLMEAL
jgi:hypothetical protein